MHEHEPDIEACDVIDKERLAVYRFFRRQWVEMLNGSDGHAISHQLRELLDWDLNFRMIIAARQICREASVLQNGTVHSFIDAGFVSHQVLAIRRLTEANSGRREREVFSLRRIVDEIKEHRVLLTREVYVCGFGHPFQPGLDNIKARHMHETFDKLSHSTEVTRTRSDRIHEDVFKELDSGFKSAESVRTYSHKVLAHAAAPSNRGAAHLRLSALREACRDLVRVARRLSAQILCDTSSTYLSQYLCDPLEGMNSPLCPEERIEDLRRIWREQVKEVGQLDRCP